MSRGKFILTGTSNDGFRHKYSVKKNNVAKKDFENFLLRLGFESHEVQKIFMKSLEEGNDNFVNVSLSPKDIIDELFYFRNNDSECEIFFGEKKIIFFVRTKKRIPITRFLEKQDWISDKEADNIRKNNQQKLKKIYNKEDKIEKIIKKKK